MALLIVVLTVIMTWCFYLKLVISFIKRKRLVWVEVQDFFNTEVQITRNDAKKNLHLVCEITKKIKTLNNMFDKYWYR